MKEYLSPQAVYEQYDLQPNTTMEPTPFEDALRKEGIAAIDMPLKNNDFKELGERFATCIEECPELLALTPLDLDTRYGSNVGYVRKEQKFDRETGQQLADGKHYFHFSERVPKLWSALGSKVMQDFLNAGHEVHDVLVKVGKRQIAELEATHPNISKLYFPNGRSYSFLRVIRNDAYKVTDKLGDVSKPHYDGSGLTIHGYGSDPGFWVSKSGNDGERCYYDTVNGMAYAFVGIGHRKVYGSEDDIKPARHGVSRIIPEGNDWVPERTAVVAFIDAPEVNFGVNSVDTLPQFTRSLGKQALIAV